MIAALLRTFVRREESSALMAVLMVLLVVAAVGAAAVQTGQHSNDVSSVDREKVQALAAADAGVNDAIRRVSAGAGCDGAPSAPTMVSDSTGLVGKWQTRIDPESGTTCGQTLKRVIHAWGFGATGGNRAMRQLQVTVSLVPQAGFPYTLFADGTSGTIFVKNTGTVAGDAYSEVLDQSKNNLDAQTIISQGSIVSKNNAVYGSTLWAAGNVSIGKDGSIGGSVIAAGTPASGSPGTIMLDNGAVVGGDAIAKSTINLAGGTVRGTVSQNNPNAPPPPVLHKPAFTWNIANYTSPVVGTAAQITTALDTAKTNLQGTYYATDGSGTITLPTSATVTGPLTIVSSGKISVGGGTFTNSGGPWQVVLVAMNTSLTSIDVAKPFTASSGLDMLWYSLGGVDGKNAVTFKGAIYADSIDFKNTFGITKSTSLATNPPVGFTFDSSSTTTFIGVPTLWREIVPGDAPS